MRQVIITGNLTKDIDMRLTTSGIEVSTTSIANNDTKDKPVYINLKAFKKTAVFMSDYLSKGSKVLIVGQIAQDRYEKDGEKKQFDYVIVDRVEFMEKKEGEVKQQTSKQEADDDIPF